MQHFDTDPSASQDFWAQRLVEGVPSIQLAFDSADSRASSGSAVVAEIGMPLAVGTTETLRAAAQPSRTPPNAWLLAAWALVLSRLSGSGELLFVGVTDIADARRPVVPFRTFVGVSMSGRDVAEGIAAEAAAVAPHRSFPLGALAPRHGDRALATWQVLFTDEGTPFWPMPLVGTPGSPAIEPDAPPADLHLIVPSDLSQPCRLRFATARFEPATAQRIVEHYVTAVASLLADPLQSAGAVSLMSKSQRDQVVVEFNRTAAEVPREMLIHQPFERRAARQPDAPALFASGELASYGELNARANQVAHALMALGVRPNDRVAICLQRSAAMVAALFGVLKAGATYVPLDPEYPPERLAYMVGDCAPAAVLTDMALRPRLPSIEVPVLAMDDVSLLSRQPAHDPDATALGLHAGLSAYLIYTSGSTGQPKGASVFHRGLVNLLHWYSNDYDFSALDRVLVVSSFSFDLTQKNLFVALFAGGELHLADPQFDPAAIVRTIEQKGITTLNLTPSAFYAIVDAQTPGALKSLRRVFLGGEPISVPRLSALGAAYPLLEIINSYGPTECTDVVAAYRLPRDGASYADATPPIGRPICNTQLYVLDSRLQPVPIGAVGEIHIGGAGVGGGYLNQAEMSAQRFIPDMILPGAQPGALLYKTGDQGRWRADGNLDYLGRNDFQVKIRGFRIELGEIESKLMGCEGVREAIVIAREDAPGDKRLIAYVMPKIGATLDPNALRARLTELLANYMVPSAFVVMAAFPLTPSGKVDRKALPRPERKRPDLSVPYQAPVGDFEAAICKAFAEVLEIDRAGRHDNFFDLGGTSLQAVRALTELAHATGRRLSAPTIFAHATAADLARAADQEASGVPAPAVNDSRRSRAALLSEPMAIIGMSGRFPGAQTVEALWQNLLEGRDGITRFTLDTLDPSVPESSRRDPTYVLARGVIDKVEWFDNSFFGISAREAEVMDPQHRLFLELAWECLERAGYAPDRTPGAVGVFGGVYGPSYLQRNVMANPKAMERAGDLQVLLTNDKDYAALRVAHKLNLKGPAVAIHSSCSTSLVAIAQAVDSLRLGRCDMALAGGVSVTSPPATGYFHNDGSMLSSDGHTRTFDADASGTIFNDGAAFVLLKPLSCALEDGDQVYAVVRSVATNNDGAGKASFTAPSVEGQAAVITMAHREAGVDARTISYVEAHGTATPLGDPVEIEALTRAFRASTDETGFCRIGSLKSNIGHMVTAAGAGGMIKTALALHTGQLPATIHYKTPNPHIDFASSPFVVNASLSAWPRGETPRRAGVSNFGVGGTNAHAVLEEAPLRSPSAPHAGAQLLQISARSASALEAMATTLADHLDTHPDLNLADVAHTLQHGRSTFAHRLGVVGVSAAECSAALRAPSSPWRVSRKLGATIPPWVWLFTGQGAQYQGMGRALYAADAAFLAAFDECLVVLDSELPFDLKSRMFDGPPDALLATSVTQPATFALEYALARAWLARGARPAALVGHSVGEFAAAVIAGVMSLDAAARLVARRGALMEAQPPGSMLSVRMAAEKLLSILPPSLCLAAENGPTTCVVSGPTAQIEAFQAQLEQEGAASKLLQTSHAFHSSMMAPAAALFEAEVRQVTLTEPSIPIASTLTGTWMSAADATDPVYWARHLRDPVRFSPAIRTALARHADAAMLEIGPRNTLAALARQHAPSGSPLIAVGSLGDRPETESSHFLLAQAQMWTAGIALDAENASPPRERRRVLLPTYPFERKRLWLEAAAAPAGEAAAPVQVQLPEAASLAALPSAATVIAALPTMPSQIDPGSMAVQALIEQQIRLMTQHLEILGGLQAAADDSQFGSAGALQGAHGQNGKLRH